MEGLISLIKAIQTNELGNVKQMVEAGSDVNLKNESGETPLFMATRMNNYDIVVYLVEHGADINYDSNKNAVFESIKLKNPKILNYLLSMGANPNYRTKGGQTPLIMALYNRFDEGVDILLKYNANPNIDDNYNESPLRIALLNDNKDILIKLLEAGAKDTTLNTVFNFIKEPDMIELLAKYGIKPQKNVNIDLQRQRNLYFYKNEYISATFLQSVLLLSSKNEEVVLSYSMNLVEIKTKGASFIISPFMVCLGLSLLFHEKLINEKSKFVYNGVETDLYNFSKDCEKYNQSELIHEQKRIKKAISSKLLQRLKKPENMEFEIIKLKNVYEKYGTTKEIFENGKVESNIYETKEIFVPKILHGEFIYNDFIQKQRNYINSLPLNDQLTINGYTHNGDVIVNNLNSFDFKEFEKLLNPLKWKSKPFPFTSQLIQLTGNPLQFSLTEQQWFNVFKLFISDFRRIIKNAPPLEYNLIVYRGLSQEFKTNSHFNKIEQFNSTTLDLKLARDFINDTCCMLQISILKGSSVLYLNSISNYPEHEVVINIGSTYLVKNKTLIDRIKTTNIVLIS